MRPHELLGRASAARLHQIRFRLLLTALFALGLAVQGCASGGGGTGAPRRDPNLLTQEELAPFNNVSLWEAVQRLRPNWLRSRGAVSLEAMTDPVPALMVDNAFGRLDDMRDMPVTGVQVVRFIPARDATMRYGTGYVHGIVEVVMAGRSPGGDR